MSASGLPLSCAIGCVVNNLCGLLAVRLLRMSFFASTTATFTNLYTSCRRFSAISLTPCLPYRRRHRQLPRLSVLLSCLQERPLFHPLLMSLLLGVALVAAALLCILRSVPVTITCA